MPGRVAADPDALRHRWAARLDAARQAQQTASSEATTQAYRAAVRFARQLGPTSPELRETLPLLADHYYHSGQQRQAVRAARRLLALQHQVLGPFHAELAPTYDLLIHFYTGHKPTEVTRFYRLELGVVEHVFGPDHFEVARVGINFASHLNVHGHPLEAMRLWERALAILDRFQRRRPRPDSWSLVSPSAITGLAACYSQRGRHADAEHLYRRQLRQALRRGRGDISVAWALLSLAREVRAQGRLAQATALLARAATVQEAFWASREDQVPALARRGVSAMRMAVLREQAAVLRALGRAVAAAAVEARIQQHEAKFELIDSPSTT